MLWLQCSPRYRWFLNITRPSVNILSLALNMMMLQLTSYWIYRTSLWIQPTCLEKKKAKCRMTSRESNVSKIFLYEHIQIGRDGVWWWVGGNSSLNPTHKHMHALFFLEQQVVRAAAGREWRQMPMGVIATNSLLPPSLGWWKAMGGQKHVVWIQVWKARQGRYTERQGEATCLRFSSRGEALPWHPVIWLAHTNMPDLYLFTLLFTFYFKSYLAAEMQCNNISSLTHSGGDNLHQ